MVGAIGAIVDFGVFNLLRGPVGVPATIAQAISFSAAVDKQLSLEPLLGLFRLAQQAGRPTGSSIPGRQPGWAGEQDRGIRSCPTRNDLACRITLARGRYRQPDTCGRREHGISGGRPRCALVELRYQSSVDIFGRPIVLQALI